MSPSTASQAPLLILTRREIANLMDFGDYVTAVEAAFRLYEEGEALSPGVLDVHAQDGAFHIKAAGLKLRRPYVAVKVNGNYSENRSRYGLPTIQGAITLCDATNGRPLAFMDSIEITINRTGAATAVGAKYLALPKASCATICGCGEQGRIQLIALKHVLPLERVYVFDVDTERARAFAKRMEADLSLEIIPVATLYEATRNSEAVVTCTTSRQPFLGRQGVRPGAFVAAVGADNHDKQELMPDLMASSTVVTDLLDQCAAIGDLHHALAAGVLAKTDVYAELGEIVAGVKPGRTSEEEIIILDTTGTALQDVAAAAAIYERALREGVGYACDLLSL